MTLTISVRDKGRARPVIAARAAYCATNSLQILADFQGFLKRPVGHLPNDRPLPQVVDRAFTAARRISEKLTSLAAVAGAVADQVADTAANIGADRVIVNNGGDIALQLGPVETAVVGLRPANSAKLIGQLFIRAHLVGDRVGICGVRESVGCGFGACVVACHAATCL